MEGSLTDETDEGPDGHKSPMDSGNSLVTSHVSTSEEEQEVDRWKVESESSHEEEITEEPMEEEDTKSVGSATTDTTLGSIVPSSQEARQLEVPLDLSSPANGGPEPASMKGELDIPMEGGDATFVVHEEQRVGQLKPPTLLLSPMNNPRQEDEPPAEVPESDQGNEVICYAMEVELKSLN